MSSGARRARRPSVVRPPRPSSEQPPSETDPFALSGERLWHDDDGGRERRLYEPGPHDERWFCIISPTSAHDRSRTIPSLSVNDGATARRSCPFDDSGSMTNGGVASSYDRGGSTVNGDDRWNMEDCSGDRRRRTAGEASSPRRRRRRRRRACRAAERPSRLGASATVISSVCV